MSRPVFLIAQQRSGTTAFRGLLRHSEFVDDFGEVFHPLSIDNEQNFFRFRLEYGRLRPWDVPTRQAMSEMFADYIDHLGSLAGKAFYVADVKYNSVHHLNADWQVPFGEPNLLKLLKSNEHHVIHLVRDDAFAMFFSERFAAATGRWHYGRNDRSTPPQEQVRIDRDRFKRFQADLADARERIDSFLRTYPRSLTLHYETLFDGLRLSDSAHDAISRFLDVELESNLQSEVRRTPVDMESAIENIDEVRDLIGS